VENFKFGLISVIALGGIGLLGYWAFTTLERGDVSVYRQKIEALQDENDALHKEVADLKSELGSVEAEQEQAALAENNPPAETPKPETPPPTITTTYKNQTLINELQKLITDNIYMKVGSKGTRVGTIQKFLNLYNKTSKPVDNDYGAGLKADVLAYQKAVGITADGETGPATYKKMIEWLKKQG
jgi:murein L,D-transpeptidase YcbB/YkuD